MALVNSSFTVNVTPGAMPPIVHVSEYDIGRTYTVTINGENGSVFNIPTGTTATVEGTLNGVIGFATDATISGSTVSFTLTESMTAKSGKAWCKIKLTLNDEPIQTCAFVLAVDRAGVEAKTVIGADGFEGQIREAAEDWLEDQGFQSPAVSITEITGGHRVTFTDAEHPQGQSIDVMDGDDANVPTKLSQFTNDAGFVTAQQAAAAAPVQSVNGKTGAVEINDVPDYSTTTTGYVLAKTGANTLGWIPPYDPSSPEYSELQEWLASDAPDDVSEALLTYLTDNNLWQDGVDPAFYAALTAAARAGKLPNVTAADNGKIAIASNGAWTVGQAPVQSVNGKTGSVTVNEVPAVGGTDNKKVLTADNGTYSWEAVQSGETTKRISLYKNSQTGVYTCSMTATQLHDALPNVVLATEDYRVPVSAYSIDKDDSYVKAVFIDDRPENNAAIVWTLSAASASDLVAVTREECSIEGLPDYTLAVNNYVLAKTTNGPRWVENIPQRAASLRLVYDGAFAPSDPDLYLMSNLGIETAEDIGNALIYGTIGSAEFVDVSTSTDHVVYDLYRSSVENGVASVVFAHEEADCIRTVTMTGNTKSVPTFGTIPLAGGTTANAVLYTEQSLTDSQKAQARTNVGAGTYSKPSGGIPKNDLASDVQASLGKADTALQQHQSLSGYATESYVQTAIASIPDELPPVTASDNGKFLRVVSGAWAAASVPFQTPRVAMTSSDTTPTLDPNKLYVFPEMATLTPTLATPTDNTIVNEYHFVFDSGATATVLTLPASVLQPDGFTVEANMHYEISILEGTMTAQGWAVTSA